MSNLFSHIYGDKYFNIFMNVNMFMEVSF